MCKYTLSINIQSENKELLENLMVTLETVNGNIQELESVELLTLSGPAYVDFNHKPADNELTVSQRNLFLDKWVISEVG